MSGIRVSLAVVLGAMTASVLSAPQPKSSSSSVWSVAALPGAALGAISIDHDDVGNTAQLGTAESIEAAIVHARNAVGQPVAIGVDLGVITGQLNDPADPASTTPVNWAGVTTLLNDSTSVLEDHTKNHIEDLTAWDDAEQIQSAQQLILSDISKLSALKNPQKTVNYFIVPADLLPMDGREDINNRVMTDLKSYGFDAVRYHWGGDSTDANSWQMAVSLCGVNPLTASDPYAGKYFDAIYNNGSAQPAANDVPIARLAFMQFDPGSNGSYWSYGADNSDECNAWYRSKGYIVDDSGNPLTGNLQYPGQLEAIVDRAIAYHGWVVQEMHGINNGFNPVNPDYYNDFIQYIAQKIVAGQLVAAPVPTILSYVRTNQYCGKPTFKAGVLAFTHPVNKMLCQRYDAKLTVRIDPRYASSEFVAEGVNGLTRPYQNPADQKANADIWYMDVDPLKSYSVNGG